MTGISGFLLTALLATPIATCFGYLVGKLFNKMKGAEMIGDLVLGYFAEGFYQLLFLFIFGGVITINNPTLMISTGVGVKNTIDLKDTVKYALDTVPMLTIIELGFYLFLIGWVSSALFRLVKKQTVNWNKTGILLLGAVIIYGLTYIPVIERFLSTDRLVLLSAVELLCAGMVLWQLTSFLIGKFVKKKEIDWKGTVVFCVLSGIVYGLTYVPGVFKILVAVQSDEEGEVS